MMWRPELGSDRREVGDQPAGYLPARGRAGIGAFGIPALYSTPLDGADLVFGRKGRLGEKLCDQALSDG